jgi:hypothetical protein
MSLRFGVGLLIRVFCMGHKDLRSLITNLSVCLFNMVISGVVTLAYISQVYAIGC